ncbi:MAG TPA: dienelactone hydrolase family protein [Acidimicrobiales bacterium]|nr:dienelactone hydrolase family protein [Acidimicrobiales bacterium]
MPDDSLDDFERTTFTHEGKTRTVLRKGTGPAVIVIAEIPGITPKVAGFARRVADIGCSAVMPHLFGDPGRDPVEGGARGAMTYMVQTIVPVCISREFTVMATGKSSPVIDWLRALAGSEHARCGGPGVGAIGMCFTGGFALAMATHPSLLAPVLSQPSLPFVPPWKKQNAHNIDISPAELATVKQRCAAEGLTVLGMRFKGDAFVPAARFDFLREQLGDAFVAIEIDDEHANPNAANSNPHSVVTEHLIDEEGQPTWVALNEVLDLFRRRLLNS